MACPDESTRRGGPRARPETTFQTASEKQSVFKYTGGISLSFCGDSATVRITNFLV